MGTWGYGPFESDTARDWLDKVSAAYGKVVRRGLNSSRLNEAYAAAALVADAREIELKARKAAGAGKRPRRGQLIEHVGESFGDEVLRDRKLVHKACSRLDDVQKSAERDGDWARYRDRIGKLRKKLGCNE